MSLKTTEYKPSNPNDPFENDPLGRGWVAEGLTQLVQNHHEEALVVSLSGDWGTGKTTFVKHWAEQLTTIGVARFYFDAYSHDYFDDPFAALVNAIEEYSKSSGVDDALIEDLMDKSSAALLQKTPIILKAIAAGWLKHITKGAFDTEEVQEAVADVGDSFIGSLGADTPAKDQYAEARSAVEQFGISLASLVSALDGPLVVIVDELDRCRPNYALALLERIKHVFSISGLVWVLVSNLQQLSSSVRSVYGTDIDAERYLQKLIDIDARLPNDGFGSEPYLRQLMHRLSLNVSRNLEDRLIRMLAALQEKNNLTLREMEKIGQDIKAIGMSGVSYDLSLAVLLANFKLREPELYSAICMGDIERGSIDAATGITALGDGIDDMEDTSILAEASTWLHMAALGGDEYNEMARNPEHPFHTTFVNFTQSQRVNWRAEQNGSNVVRHWVQNICKRMNAFTLATS